MKNQIVSFTSVDKLKDWLTSHSINTEVWNCNQAKSIDRLYEEIMKGESYIQNNPPMRIVNVVQVLVKKGEKYLLELEQEMEDKRKRKRHIPPSEKMKPGEDCLIAAKRCLVEELDIQEGEIQFLTGICKPSTSERNSRSYPGLRTQYRIYQVEIDLKSLPDENFWTKETSMINGLEIIRHHYWGWGKL